MLIRVDGFDGIYPRMGPYLLANNAAQVADNVKLYSGELRSWLTPADVKPNPPSVVNPKTIYLLVNPLTKASSWLTWGPDVDLTLSVTADATDGRVYYTGDGAPRKTNYALAVQGVGPYPADYLELGVPAPINPPSVISSGGSTPDTRVYAYTFISEFGALEEESAPSPPATVQSNATGATVTVSGLGTAGPAGKYNITKKRIYRTVGGEVTGDFRLVAEIPITQASYTDTALDVELELDTLKTLDYTPPPPDLKGLVRMAGGFLAAFRNNEVWFSEPNAPHAWPAKYVLTTRAPIVGLAALGSFLAVMTTESPEAIYGQSPDTLSQEVITLIEPCISKRSIATDGDVAIYASPNGLVAVGPSTRRRFTDTLFRRDEWLSFTPSTMYGVVYDGSYFGFYTVGGEASGALIVNSTDRPALARADFFASGATVVLGDAGLHYYDSARQVITRFDSGDDVVSYTWRSKKFRLPIPTNLNALQVFARYDQVEGEIDVDASIAFNQNLINTGTTNGQINGGYINEFSANQSNLIIIGVAGKFVGVQLFGDGVQFFSKRFFGETSVKLPSGFKYSTLEIQLTGNVPVESVAVANSVAELKEQV